VVKAPTIEDKRQAQGAALQAATLLDEGKEAEARGSLDRALKLDPKNELANTLLATIIADPDKELGTNFFRYTVKPGDTLSRIAEQYIKEQYKFYLLARYNGISVPRSLRAGQTIKVPGTKPLAETKVEPARPTKATERIKVPVDDARARTAYEECKRLMKAGDNDRAYERCREAASLSPKDAQYQSDTDHLRADLIQTYDRKARESYRRQDLDACIRSWDRVLQLDPANEPAERERDRCVRLRDTINSVSTR
jgi:tetratricopeptide (TPR) repeat protein